MSTKAVGTVKGGMVQVTKHAASNGSTTEDDEREAALRDRGIDPLGPIAEYLDTWR